MENLFDFNSGDLFDELNPINDLGGKQEPLASDDVLSEDDAQSQEVLNEIIKEDIGEEVFDSTSENIDVFDNDEEPDEDKEKNRRKGSNANKAIKMLIEKKVIAPFEDNDDVSKYNAEDIAELIEANIEEIKNEIISKKVDDLLADMPEELKILNKYYLEGGRDIKSMLTALSKISDVKSLKVGEDDEMIVRLYLKHINFGTDDEIDEEIDILKRNNTLSDKAKKFKVKLDEINDKILEEQIKEQKKQEEEKQKIVEAFIGNVKKSLSDGKINDVNLNNSKVNELIDGLIKPNYDSISGKKTNKLGYLLEKYQFVEPNIKLVAEALWLLSNPDEYKNMLIKKGEQMALENVKKEIKTESQRTVKSSTMYGREADEDVVKTQKRPLKKNFFTRNF